MRPQIGLLHSNRTLNSRIESPSPKRRCSRNLRFTPNGTDGAAVDHIAAERSAADQGGGPGAADRRRAGDFFAS